jgi:hypothetical protein
MASTCGGAVAGALFLAFARKNSRTPEPTCTGYQNAALTWNHDCKALRSALCGDGRCSFHCGKHCKCEAAYEARKCA